MEHATSVLTRPDSAAAAWDYVAQSIHARHYDTLEEQLKERGREGWELVHIALPMPNEYLCIFKRPLH
jgi:hypothetical protein